VEDVFLVPYVFDVHFSEDVVVVHLPVHDPADKKRLDVIAGDDEAVARPEVTDDSRGDVDRRKV